MDDEIIYAVLFSTMVLLFLIALILVLFLKSGRKRAEQELIIAKTKLESEEELKRVSVEVSEHLRQEISIELHDNVGQLHTTISVQLENLIFDNPVLKEQFTPVKSSLAEVMLQTRQLARSLNSEFIGSIGLASSLNLEISRIRSLRRFEVHWRDATGIGNLTSNQELMIFRIFQEVSQNTIRHASANNFYVELKTADDQFELSVKDDGNGFDKDVILNSDKVSGLSNIVRRAKIASVICKIESAVGCGTHIVLIKAPNEVQKT